jgi:hypothetical protein
VYAFVKAGWSEEFESMREAGEVVSGLVSRTLAPLPAQTLLRSDPCAFECDVFMVMMCISTIESLFSDIEINH